MLPILTPHPARTVKTPLPPWQLPVLILAGWVNRRQQNAIEYLVTENRVLREKLGKNRILLSDRQRRLLAVKGKILGRKMRAVLTKEQRDKMPQLLQGRHPARSRVPRLRPSRRSLHPERTTDQRRPSL
jgi:hypothetical protein